MESNTVQLLDSLLDADRRWTACELAAEVRVCHKTVLHILHDFLDAWTPHEISEVQLWHHYAVAQAFLDHNQREGDDFLERIIAMDKTWSHSYEQNLKFQLNEWKHSGFRPKKVHPTQCAVK